MALIPGAWEPRPRSAAVPQPVALAPAPPVAARADNAPATEARRVELPAWMKVSIFAGTLLAATWIAMALFF